MFTACICHMHIKHINLDINVISLKETLHTDYKENNKNTLEKYNDLDQIQKWMLPNYKKIIKTLIFS